MVAHVGRGGHAEQRHRRRGSLLLAALDDPNPVLVLEHKLLYKQSFGGARRNRPLGREGRIERAGTDLTIVATSVEVQRSVQAAEQLAEQGISAEVIDPRTIAAGRTAHPAVGVAYRPGAAAQEAPKFAGFMAEVSATIAESSLRRPAGADQAAVRARLPDSYSPTLEKASAAG